VAGRVGRLNLYRYWCAHGTLPAAYDDNAGERDKYLDWFRTFTEHEILRWAGTCDPAPTPEDPPRPEFLRDRQLWFVRQGEWCAALYLNPADLEPSHPAVVAGLKAVWVVPHLADDPNLNAFVLGRIESSVLEHGGDCQWLVDFQKFRRLARKAPGITPEVYCHRPGSTWNAPETPAAPEGSSFSTRLAQRLGMPSPVRLQAILPSISQQMIHDLLVLNQPVDIGFALIVAVPYRANWKQILASASEFNLSAILEQNPSLMRYLNSLILAGVRPITKERVGFSWTLEIVPKPIWERLSGEVENAIALHGDREHLIHWSRIVQKLRPSILASLREYSRSATLPAGTIPTEDTRLAVWIPPEEWVQFTDPRKCPVQFKKSVPMIRLPDGTVMEFEGIGPGATTLYQGVEAVAEMPEDSAVPVKELAERIRLRPWEVGAPQPESILDQQ